MVMFQEVYEARISYQKFPSKELEDTIYQYLKFHFYREAFANSVTVMTSSPSISSLAEFGMRSVSNRFLLDMMHYQSRRVLIPYSKAKIAF